MEHPYTCPLSGPGFKEPCKGCETCAFLEAMREELNPPGRLRRVYRAVTNAARKLTTWLRQSR